MRPDAEQRTIFQKEKFMTENNAHNPTQDMQSVDRNGEVLLELIDGLVVSAPPVHEDHRGVLVEMYREDGFWQEPFAYAYQTSLRPGVAKGWFLHKENLTATISRSENLCYFSMTTERDPQLAD